MKKTLFITRNVDGSFMAIPCNNHSTIDQTLTSRIVWHDYLEKDIRDHIKNCSDCSVIEGLKIALKLYNENKRKGYLLPAMFITSGELDTMTSAMISQKQETIKEVMI